MIWFAFGVDKKGKKKERKKPGTQRNTTEKKREKDSKEKKMHAWIHDTRTRQVPTTTLGKAQTKTNARLHKSVPSLSSRRTVLFLSRFPSFIRTMSMVLALTIHTIEWWINQHCFWKAIVPKNIQST